jgi:hypothetical protein
MRETAETDRDYGDGLAVCVDSMASSDGSPGGARSVSAPSMSICMKPDVTEHSQRNEYKRKSLNRSPHMMLQCNQAEELVSVKGRYGYEKHLRPYAAERLDKGSLVQ